MNENKKRKQTNPQPHACAVFGPGAVKSSPFLTDFDLYLLGEGTHLKSYEKLGAHVAVKDGVAGVSCNELV